MNQIGCNTGFHSYWVTPDIANEAASTIDVFIAVDGDANNDGELGMADAVYIMQSIANPDKYQLTAQGRFNADIADTGNGITTKDALAVQQRLLGLE